MSAAPPQHQRRPSAGRRARVTVKNTFISEVDSPDCPSPGPFGASKTWAAGTEPDVESVAGPRPPVRGSRVPVPGCAGDAHCEPFGCRETESAGLFAGRACLGQRPPSRSPSPCYVSIGEESPFWAGLGKRPGLRLSLRPPRSSAGLDGQATPAGTASRWPSADLGALPTPALTASRWPSAELGAPGHASGPPTPACTASRWASADLGECASDLAVALDQSTNSEVSTGSEGACSSLTWSADQQAVGEKHWEWHPAPPRVDFEPPLAFPDLAVSGSPAAVVAPIAVSHQRVGTPLSLSAAIGGPDDRELESCGASACPLHLPGPGTLGGPLGGSLHPAAVVAACQRQLQLAHMARLAATMCAHLPAPPGLPPTFQPAAQPPAVEPAAAQGSWQCHAASAAPGGRASSGTASAIAPAAALGGCRGCACGGGGGGPARPSQPGASAAAHAPGTGVSAGRGRPQGSRRLRMWAHLHLHMQAPGFDQVPRLIGRGGSTLRGIAERTGSKIRIRGRGSGHLEVNGTSEAPCPLMVAVTTDRQDNAGFASAVEGVVRELRALERRFHAFCEQRGVQHEGPGFSVGLLGPGAQDLLGQALEGVAESRAS
ncbi:unnamed protein product [Prorocentrum cordatum]|uniref:K Homology domain-containing protein n=1 Tax=Prorocentrum cordatum TaxID=2364126 RepID=A0ABN9QZD8_9DINO|nr:unnamed protein product [Polarella glacialis]